MKHLPNLLTLLNASFGVMAIYFIQAHSMNGVAACIIAASLCDLLDGLLARRLGVSGPLGQQLDSLADAISFGAVPAFLWSSILSDYGQLDVRLALFLGSLIASSSIYRLGRFNLDPSQSLDFKGMPTPANALFALGLWAWLGRWDNWQWVVSLSQDQRMVTTLVMVALWGINLYWLNASFHVLSFKSGGAKSRTYGQYAVVLAFLALSYFLGSLALSIVVFLLPIITYITQKTANGPN